MASAKFQNFRKIYYVQTLARPLRSGAYLSKKFVPMGKPVTEALSDVV